MSNAAIQVEYASSHMAKLVSEIVGSIHFNKEEIHHEQFTLLQGYCLLWQEPSTGEVKWRKFGIEPNAGAAAATLVDLVVLGKAEVEVVPNTTLGVQNDTIIFKVVSECPTDTYIDAAMFNEVLKKHKKKPWTKVKDWIRNDLWKMQARNRCSTIALESLVELGVFSKESKLIGNKYPTLQPGVQEKLVQEIRAVALKDQEPSSYIRALLALTRGADNLLVLSDPCLQKHFSKEEYPKAKERMNALVGIEQK